MSNDSVKNLNGKILTSIIDFDFIVNTELGLIRFIRDKYQDEKSFKLDILNKSDRDILSLLYYREDPNPISIISQKDYLPNINKLYDYFFKEYKLDILNRSVSNFNIFTFVKYSLISEANLGINVSITCRDDIETKQIETHFERPRILSRKEVGIILSKDIYYVRDYKFFTDLKLEDSIIHKKIYMNSGIYNINYFENETNNLTSRNAFILVGKDYREKTDGIQSEREQSNGK